MNKIQGQLIIDGELFYSVSRFVDIDVHRVANSLAHAIVNSIPPDAKSVTITISVKPGK